MQNGEKETEISKALIDLSALIDVSPKEVSIDFEDGTFVESVLILAQVYPEKSKD